MYNDLIDEIDMDLYRILYVVKKMEVFQRQQRN